MEAEEEECSNNEALLLEVLQSGKARLAWARFENEPWWPCLHLDNPAWDTLRSFTKVTLEEPTGDVEKGKALVFFLGESSYEVIDRGQVTKYFYDRKPSQKERESNPNYGTAVDLSERLVKALEASARPNIDKLREVLKSGGASLIWAYTETMWWPSVQFSSWESAEATGAEIGLNRKALKEDRTLVYRLGDLPNSWQVVKRWVPYEEKRHQKNTNSSLDKSFCISPDSERSYKQDEAVTQAESLRHFLRAGQEGESSTAGSKRGLGADCDAEDEGEEEDHREGRSKRAKVGAGKAAGQNGASGAAAVVGRKRGRKGSESEGTGNGAVLPLKYMGRQRRRKKLTPEEVRKIRRLAEGLMYMAAVQDTPTLMADLTELRESLSMKRRGTIERARLQRLEEGLEAYAKKMKQQLSDGDKSYRRYQAQVEEASSEHQNVCMALSKDLAKVSTTLNEQRDRLSEQMRSWSGKKGFNGAVRQEGKLLQKLLDMITPLEDLKVLVKEPRTTKQRMADSLLDNAEVAFKIGEELTQDQMAAAEQLRRTCTDFMARLDRAPHEAFF